MIKKETKISFSYFTIFFVGIGFLIIQKELVFSVDHNIDQWTANEFIVGFFVFEKTKTKIKQKHFDSSIAQSGKSNYNKFTAVL